MTVSYIVNNYTLGAKVRTSPAHKISNKDRIDRNHTKITYTDLTQKEKEFTDKLFAKKGKVEEY